MKIHHIGYLVEDLTKSLKQFEKLGFRQTTKIVHDDIRKIELVFIEFATSLGGGYY